MANDMFEQGQDYLRGLFDAAQQKQTNLQQARDDKLAALTNPKPMTIAGYDDADTVKSTDGTTYRLQAADKTMYDAIESKHGDKPIDMYGGTGAYQKSPLAMNKQRELVARLTNKQEKDLTEQDFVDVSNWQLVQSMADQANGPGVWEAPFGRGTAPLDMSGKEAPLNIPATVQTAGRDKAGRTLGVLGTEAGIDATTAAAHDKNRNIYANTAPVSDDRIKAYEAAIANSTGSSVGDRLANAGKGLLYRAAEGILQTADLVPEVVEYGYKKLTGNPNANWSDVEGLYSDETGKKIKNFLGYDESKMQALAEKAKSAVLHAYDKGDYWGVLKTLGEAVMTPEVAGESGGFILSMLLPGTIGVKALRAASGTTKAVEAAVAAEEAALVAAGKTVSSAEKTMMTAKALKAAEDEAGMGYKLSKMIAENPGYVNYAEQVARDSEKEYKEKYGTEMDGMRRTGAFLLGLVSGKLDAAMGQALIAGKDPVAKLIKAAFNEAPEAVQKSTAIAIAKSTGMPIGRVVGAMAEEGFTEGLQTALENTAARYNSERPEGSMKALFTDKENLAEIGRDALIGAAGGAQFAGPSTARDVIAGGTDAVTKELRKIADKAERNTPEARAAATQAEEAQAATTTQSELAKKVEVLTPEQKAKLVVSMESLMLPSETVESTEIKNTATSVLQGKDDKGVLGADIDDAEAGKRIKNAVIAADGSIIANIDNVVDNVQKLRPNMSREQISEIVDNAFVVRSALDTIAKKTTNEVSKEVTTGSRGFETYFRNIMQAQAVGDEVTANEYVTKLEKFAGAQESKVRTIEGLVSTMESQLDNAAKAMVNASEGKIGYEEALRAASTQLGERSNKPERGRVGKVSYGTGTFEMSYKTVAERMMLPEGQRSSFRGGGFTGLMNMREELNAMQVLVKEVTGQPQTAVAAAPQVAAAPVVPLKDRVRAWIDAKLANGGTIEGIQKLVDGLDASKAESKQIATEYLQELMPAVEASAPITEMPSIEQPETSSIEQSDMTEDVVSNEMDYEALADDVIMEVENTDSYVEDMQADVMEMDIPMDNDYDAMYFGDEGVSVDHEYNVFDMWGRAGFEVKNTEVRQLMKEQAELEVEMQKLMAEEASEEQIADVKTKIDEVRKQLESYREYATKLTEISSAYGGVFFGIEGQAAVINQLLKSVHVTGLSYKQIEILPEAKVMAENALTKLGFVVQADGSIVDAQGRSILSSSGKLYSSDVVKNNPAVALLITKDGKRAVVNSNVANAMYAAKVSYLANNMSEFTTSKTDEEMEDMFGGFQDYDMLSPSPIYTHIQQYGGVFDKFVAADAGAEVMTYLGLKQGEMSTPQMWQGFVAGFGAMIINDMTGVDGLLQEVRTDAATVLVASKDEKGKIMLFDARDANNKEAKRLENEYLIDNDRSRGPSLRPQKADRRVTIHHQPYADATDTQVATVRKLESMSMKVNEGYEILDELFENDEQLLKAIGVEAIDEKTQTMETRNSLQAANRAHTDGLKYLREAKQQFADAVMYFKWFVTKGGRFNLDSTTVNPQSNKQLHRWLVTAVDGESELSVAEVRELANYEVGNKLSDAVIALAYGMVQGFGKPVDKMNQNDVLLEAKKLMNMTKAELIAHAKNEMNNSKVDHVGQMAVAIAAVARFREAELAGNESFKTNLTVEFDGLTNGFSFKIMQYPLNDYKEWLPKIGVLLEGSTYSEANSMNAVRANKEQKLNDTYETIGVVMQPRLFSNESAAADTKAMIAEANREQGALVTTKQVETAAAIANKLISSGIAPAMEIVNGIVSKTIREIMKNPTMIFNYGAGIAKIAQNVTVQMVNSTIDKLYVLAQEQPEVVADILGIADVQGLVIALRDKDLTDKTNAFVRNKLYDAYKVMYGVPVARALEKKFKEYIKLNKAINSAFGLMYVVFKNKADAVATEMYKAGQLEGHYGSDKKIKSLTLDALSTDDAIAVIRAMVVRGLVPSVSTPDTKSKIQQLVVFDRAIAEIKSAAKNKQEVDTPNSARVMQRKGTEADGRDKYIQLFTRIVGNPGAAGGVLMTHTKDGLTIGETILKYPHLGVHDASVWGLMQAKDGTRDYNKNWYTINKQFSDVDAVIEALERASKLDNTVDVSETMATLRTYQEIISKNRVELYSQNAKIGQQVGMEGTMYEVDARAEHDMLMNETIKVVEEIADGLPKTAKKQVQTAIERHANDPIGLVKTLMTYVIGENTVEYAKLKQLAQKVKSSVYAEIANVKHKASSVQAVFTADERRKFANPLMKVLVRELRPQIVEKDISGAQLIKAIYDNVNNVVAHKDAILSSTAIDDMYVRGAYVDKLDMILHPGSKITVDADLQKALDTVVAELNQETAGAGDTVAVKLEPEWSKAVARAVYNRRQEIAKYGTKIPVEVLLHELGHALTATFIANNKEHVLVKELTAIFEVIKPVLLQDEYFSEQDTYWQTNVEEFVSEALSNPALVKKLASIPVDNVQDIHSVLDAIVRFVAKLFGAAEHTMYDAVMLRLSQIAMKDNRSESAQALLNAAVAGNEMVGNELDRSIKAGSAATEVLMTNLSKVNPAIAQIIMNDVKDC